MKSIDEITKNAELSKLQIDNSGIANDSIVQAMLTKAVSFKSHAVRKDALKILVTEQMSLEACEALLEETSGTNSVIKMQAVLDATCKPEVDAMKRRQNDYGVGTCFWQSTVQLAFREEFKAINSGFAWAEFRKLLLDVITEKRAPTVVTTPRG